MSELDGTVFERLSVGGRTYAFRPVADVPGADRLPACLVVLLENVLRRGGPDAALHARRILDAGLAGEAGEEIDFMPARVLFQDFTGVPVFADFAAMRDAARERGADPDLVNPQIPCTLVVDHSVCADVAGEPDALERNMALEAQRNAERFSFLKWSSQSFDNVRIVPPGRGICHQLNIERLCRAVAPVGEAGGVPLVAFDTLVGTDSHTTTANGMGSLGWGVGGIEAEAAALGQPVTMRVPSVVGVRLHGALPDGACAMDVALSFAEMLRAEGVVGSLVECFGEGVAALTPTQRATVANMTPEYGATATFFPADELTLRQLELFGADADEVALARAYLEVQGLLGVSVERRYARVLDFDFAAVEPSLAGPSLPHARTTVAGLKSRFEECARARGRDLGQTFEVEAAGSRAEVGHGTVAIAAVTSCTTATDPAMMVACGLAARRAVELGCEPLPWVKKVLAPGSRSTVVLLERAGLLEPLARLGFATCGLGCMSCIGNSGEIHPALKAVAADCELASVLSGNRNFDGRINPDVSQNYLASPALVVAFSLAGTVDRDLSAEPLCQGAAGPVMLSDVLPSAAEVDEVLRACLDEDVYAASAQGLPEGDAAWEALAPQKSSTFAWDGASTYVRRPPYFDDVRSGARFELSGARVLALLGDAVTTDHISPAGTIAPDSPAASYLRALGVADEDFNTYGSRRGNHEVMMRGCFANVKLENRLAGGRLGAWTRDCYDGGTVPMFDLARKARERGDALVVVAGELYGSGSSRDWAAKAPALLGVRAVIARSFERIHRSNLVGMGVLPLEFVDGQSAESLGLTGEEAFSVEPVDFSGGVPQPRVATVSAERPDGTIIRFRAAVRVDTPTEGAYFSAGGILPYVLDGLARPDRSCSA